MGATRGPERPGRERAEPLTGVPAERARSQCLGDLETRCLLLLLLRSSKMMLAEQAQKWFPTHVQVTVLQAKGLKPKGKNGSNDAYTIIQLGKEKYSTSVAEKTLDPLWKEEASFELPGLLMQENPEKYILYLIVMHRSLVGLDKFLGQVAISLNDIFEDKQRRKTE